jgi:hypothetical protein
MSLVIILSLKNPIQVNTEGKRKEMHFKKCLIWYQGYIDPCIKVSELTFLKFYMLKILGT